MVVALAFLAAPALAITSSEASDIKTHCENFYDQRGTVNRAFVQMIAMSKQTGNYSSKEYILSNAKIADYLVEAYKQLGEGRTHNVSKANIAKADKFVKLARAKVNSMMNANITVVTEYDREVENLEALLIKLE
ncbi:hypothetical protein EON64_10095 [archaeon]|nr:MAG: hypothetical protein EON64_10095 [archaeon]